MLKEEILNVSRKASPKELRKFGITIGIFLGIISGVLFWKESIYFNWVLGVSIAFLSIGSLVPTLLKPVYLVWMSFAVIMGYIMSHLILGIIFLLVFSPVGLILRLLRKDPLKEKIDPTAKSYWIMREKTVYEPQSTERQY
ncbi:MAG: hypothetical protein D6748_14820 [Calditrichaeota bacterium]|nr:MAG: hypothetical protein D6748_14820 [Calditrichota bacterium]